MKKLLLALFFLTALQLEAATYYVATTGSDSNSGSISSPWLTINHAKSVAVAGDTVLVGNGTYIESVDFNSHAGSVGSPITFKSQNKWGAVIACSDAQLIGGNCVYIDANYFIFKDFEVVGPSDGAAHGAIKVNLRTNVQVLGNKLHHFGTAPTFSSTCPLGAGVFTAGDNNTISGNLIYDVGPPYTVTCNQIHGIYAGNIGINGIVQNNILVDIRGGWGFQWDSYVTGNSCSGGPCSITGWTITGNTFINDGNTSKNTGGCILNPGTSTPAVEGGNKINNNIF